MTIEMPRRIASLSRERGLPIPFFVMVKDGKPDFRVMDPAAAQAAYARKLCWTCGQTLGSNMTFVGGPLVVAQRASAELPSHLDCATYAAQVCPFMSNPGFIRDEKDRGQHGTLPGTQIQENPGITALYVTRGYTMSASGLLELGPPTETVRWFAGGREVDPNDHLDRFAASLRRFLAVAGHSAAARQRMAVLRQNLAAVGVAVSKIEGLSVTGSHWG